MFILRIEHIDDVVVSRIFQIISVKPYTQQNNVFLTIKLGRNSDIYNICLHVIDVIVFWKEKYIERKNRREQNRHHQRTNKRRCEEKCNSEESIASARLIVIYFANKNFSGKFCFLIRL